MLILAMAALVCALVPCLLFCRNLLLYRAPAPASAPLPVSILIPARNEEASIAGAIRAALSSTGVEFEVIVLDDQSADATAAIVEDLARDEPRVRLAFAPPLPRGWNGKQHACWQLAQLARHPVLCFVDADVRLEPRCVSSMAALLVGGRRSLVSGFPRQQTGTTLEWLLLPLIHFVLLGFLPLRAMRAGTDPAYAAGCGQFLMVLREDYFATGGHSRIKLTMHDGLRLPRLFREHGLRTDLADLTTLATCRMYTSAAEVWSGLAKNATEGLAAPIRIAPISLLLALGQVLPFAVVGLLLLRVAALGLARDRLLWHGGLLVEHPASIAATLVAFLLAASLAWLPRILAVRRFRQDWRGALLHPVGIVVLLGVQWYALIRQLSGGSVSWKNRAYVGE